MRLCLQTGNDSKVAYEQVFLPLAGKVVSGDVLPWTSGDITGKHWLHLLGCFMLSAWGISSHIVGYVCINTWPVDING